jgi:tRNA (cytidine/uridine-2'-O-)-methyltransferase
VNRERICILAAADGPAALVLGKDKRRRSGRRLLAPLPGERKPAIAAMTKSRTNRLLIVVFWQFPVQKTDPAGRMRIALYQPDIPQNTGTILRLAACLGVEAHIVEPTGFPSSDRAFRRAGMDYLDQVTLVRHVSWATFDAWRRSERLRLVLFTTGTARSYLDHAFGPDDILMFGSETAGVPEAVHKSADARLKIPMREGLRSLNVAMAAALAVGEALRQTGGFPIETGPAV